MSTVAEEDEIEDDDLLRELAATPDGAVLPRKTLIESQYEIERVIGEGGMGVVYLARDRKLEREVAIKVGIERSAASITRLAREALALARLSHPNVVVIYQVGEIGGRSYVAMEYVPGGTARAWCIGRSWREIVALYVAAGEGLAAAHAAGLVHRDVKPDNVLVGSDGRPRVADFGLAHSDGDAIDVAGTPAYMAPEQQGDGDIDARADQFSYCASLWEALYAVRWPLRGARKMPAHVEAALRRGLAPRREDRWASMVPLLAELRRDPARRTRVIAIGAAILALGAASALTIARTRLQGDPCGGGERAIATTWSVARAAEVRTAIAPDGAAAWLQLTATRTVGEIDAWTQRWAVQHRAVCEASRGAWSTELADRGVECLAQSQRDLATTIEVLIATKEVAAHADRLIEKLAGPERCADATYISVIVAPPDDAAQAARVRDEMTELARIEALVSGGRYADAGSLAKPALERARVLGYRPLVARAERELGQTASATGEYEAAAASFRSGYYAARESRDAETAAANASGLAIALLDLSRDGEANEWAHLADVEAMTSGDPAAQLDAVHALTVIEQARDEPARALADADRYIVLARSLGAPPTEPLRARSQALDLLGRYDDALADLDTATRALQLRYRDHPTIADIDRERALVLLHLHRSDDAVVAARHALTVAETTEGPDSVEANNALATLGVCLKDAKRFDEALPVLQRSLALTRIHDGPRSYNAASDMNNLADLEQAMGKLDDALATWTESRAVFAEVVGPEGNEVGIVDGNIANAYITAGRIADATDAAARAIVVTRKTPDSPIHAQALIAVGLTQVEHRDFVHARAILTEGLAKLDDDPRWRHRAHFALAKIDLAEGHVAEARVHANSALVDARLSDVPSTLLAIEQLLARLPPEPRR